MACTRLRPARLAVGAGRGAGGAHPRLLRGVERARAARERELKAAPSAKLAEADFDVMTASRITPARRTRSSWPTTSAISSSSSASSRTKYEYSVLLPWPGSAASTSSRPIRSARGRGEKIRGDQWADKPGILPAYNATRRRAT
jgi:hypothetical protein